ncbi:MAG: sulfatase-like hydrolase/transferase [Kiritimatiellae bacterium]|nr:sulfatase-like hydrolase/transferase [Kiritimatiellia bacterium]
MDHAPCNRRDFLKTLSLGAAGLMAPRSVLLRSMPQTPRPNIIFILTDDQGWGDGKSFGHPYMKTPSIDRLAREGAWFKQFYVASAVCSPSRTAFMTGHFPARHGVHSAFPVTRDDAATYGMPGWLDPDVTTVCDVLRAAGYATAHFGKWHLCVKDFHLYPNDPPPAPGEYGIDDHRTHGSSGPGWDEASYEPYWRARSSGLFVDETIRFIREHKSGPFYVNLWMQVPHATLYPTPEELAVYAGLNVNTNDFQSYMRDYLAAAPNRDSRMQTFCAAVTGMDAAVGRLLDFLDREGLANNTIIFFSSDNGPEQYWADVKGVGSPGVFRARKRSLYEGGIRTPLVVRWPGKVQAGRTDGQSVLTAVDFLPTVCGLAGIPLPYLKPDGEDVTDILTGHARARRKPIMWEWRFAVSGPAIYQPPELAVRAGNWKLFVNHDGTDPELYDIPNDPEERTNLAAAQPQVVCRLKQQVLEWKATLPN